MLGLETWSWGEVDVLKKLQYPWCMLHELTQWNLLSLISCKEKITRKRDF